MNHSSSSRDTGVIPLLTACGALWGAVAGLLTALVFLFFNPVFIDSPGGFFLWFVLLPAGAGLLAGLVVGLAGRLLPSSGERLLPGVSSLGLALVIVAAFAIPGVPLGLGLGLFGSPFASLLLVMVLLLAAGFFCAWQVVYRRSASGSRSRMLRVSLGVALIAVLALAVFWPVSAFLRAPPASLAGNGLKILVIGLDGGSPIILDDMVSRGELPTFASMMEQGCFGELTSLTPIFSPMIWTSIATGKLPEKHGVRDFLNASYLDIKAKTIWEIFEEQGGKTGLYEWLCTWPPVKLNGFLVPGWLARNSLTYPTSLEFIKEIKTAGKSGAESSSRIRLGLDVLKAVKHGMRLTALADLGTLYVYNGVFKPTRTEVHYKKYLTALAMDADIFEYLLATEKPEYAFYYHQTIDPISHVYWQYYDPDGFGEVTDEEVRRFGGVIENAYREMDRVLGHLLNRLGPETEVMIVSDHGFQSILDGPKNTGLLVTIRADSLLHCLGIEDLEGFHTMSQLFMTAQTDDADRASQILNQALKTLGSFWLPDVDLPLFIPELIDNPGTKADYVRISLNMELKDYFLAGQITENGTIVRYDGGQCPLGNLIWRKFHSGVHHPEGIFLVKGPGIRHGVRLPEGESRVLDVTPTLLAMAGLPVARDMDGRVLYELFEDGAAKQAAQTWVDTYGNGEVKKPIIGQTDTGGDDGLREQLQQLGYIDG